MLNKYGLADKIREKYPNLTPREAIILVEYIFQLISNEIKDKNQVHIMGFGRFYLKELPERVGWNPLKKEKTVVKPTNIMRFTATETFKRYIRR